MRAGPLRIPAGALLVCLLGLARARAGTGLELRPSTTTVVLGEAFPIEGTARFPSRFELRLDTSPLENFAVLAYAPLPSREEGQEKTARFTLSVLPLALGGQTLPALDFALRGPGGGALKSPSIPFTVLPPSDIRGGDKTLRDLKPLWVRLAPAWRRPALLFLLLALFLAVGIFLLRLGKKKRERTKEPLLPPDLRALRALDELEAAGLADARAVYERLSMILRDYLEGRFGFPAPYLTTHDLLLVFKQAEWDRGFQAEARLVLTTADLVKFARHEPGEARAGADLERVRALVRATAPAPPPAAVKAGTA